MEEEKVRLHLAAGEACGREATCGKKQNHGTEGRAAKAAASLNRSGNARHKVEAYPCFWCGGWHVGRKMDEAELAQFPKPVKWLTRIQPWCKFCGWRWRWGWIEYDYQCAKHWDDGETYC